MTSSGRTSLNTGSLQHGDSLDVEGTIQEVEKPLQNAERSSPRTLAWLKDANIGEPICVNPVHVVTLTPAAKAPGG
jgi:hypothetical protein